MAMFVINAYAGSPLSSAPCCSHGLASAPRVHQASLDADKESRERFPGYGSAIVQAYNHVILPLTSFRDKHTQLIRRRIAAAIPLMRHYTGGKE